jgi:lipopolysaccharide/colanic/teichoic acid biosynthesis glycosyltransferase
LKNQNKSNIGASRFIILNPLERKGIILIGDLLIVLVSLNIFINEALDALPKIPFSAYILFIIGVAIYMFMAYVLDFYNIDKTPIRSIISKSIYVSTGYVMVVFLMSVLLVDASFWRVPLLIFLFLTPIQILLWRLFFFNIFRLVPTVKKVLYIYDDKSFGDKNHIDMIDGDSKETYYKVKISCDLNQEIEGKRILMDAFEKVDAIILNVKDYQDISIPLGKSIVQAIEGGKEVLSYTSFYENTYEALPIQTHKNSFFELLQLKNKRIRFIYRLFSILVNASLSFGIGLVFMLSIPFVWFFNLFLNRGPLFYTQKRVGQFGREFDIYKFRSMVTNAEKSGAKMATKNDARITALGRVLRMFRIDELPQILSVIKGDMVFIGPRPERKVFADKLLELTPFYNVRHLVKPGITGWAQVKYKYGENLEDSLKKLEYDLYYIKNKSVTLDLRIIFKTITTVLFSRGI